MVFGIIILMQSSKTPILNVLVSCTYHNIYVFTHIHTHLHNIYHNIFKDMLLYRCTICYRHSLEVCINSLHNSRNIVFWVIICIIIYDKTSIIQGRYTRGTIRLNKISYVKYLHQILLRHKCFRILSNVQLLLYVNGVLLEGCALRIWKWTPRNRTKIFNSTSDVRIFALRKCAYLMYRVKVYRRTLKHTL